MSRGLPAGTPPAAVSAASAARALPTTATRRAGARPGAPATGRVRLFLARWPGEATRRRLAAWRDCWRWPPGTAVVPDARLHVTLHFLGAVPQSDVACLIDALAVPFEPFALRLGAPAQWPGGIAALVPDAVPPGLLRLHADLGAALRGLGLPVEARAYRPHVTLARRAAGAQAPDASPALHWPVRAWVLVQSTLGPSGGYRVLRRFDARRAPEAGPAADGTRPALSRRRP